MKDHKNPTPSTIDKEFPLLPWNRQKAILQFFLYGTGADEDFYKGMSLAERRFYRAVIDVIDAYGPVPDARYREIIRTKPVSG
jgi:hypothetical protein